MANRKLEARLQNLIRRIVREELQRAKEMDHPQGFSQFKEHLISPEASFKPSEKQDLLDEPPPWAFFGAPQPDPKKKGMRRKQAPRSRPSPYPRWPESDTPHLESRFDAPPFLPAPPSQDQ